MNRGVRAVTTAFVSLAAALALAASASAAPVVDGEFPLPAGETVGANNEIVQGPDGNMWLTTETNTVVRVTPAGATEKFAVPNTAVGITAGPDGNLWASTTIGVLRIEPTSPPTITPFTAIGLNNGAGITAGPDNRIWVAGTDELISFDPANPDDTEVETTIASLTPKGMSVGSDGLLWIADGGGRVISATAEATPTVTPYDVGFGPQDVAGGPGSQVAWANPLSSPHQVGLLTSGGTPQPIPIETSDPFGVVFGQDGAYWVARSSTDDLLRLTTDGQTSTLTGFSDSGNVGPRKIATGPGNTLWVTLDTQEAVARVSGVEVDNGNGNGPETTIDKKPKKKLKLKGNKRKAKAKFKFSSSDPATTFECKLKRKQARKAAEFKACKSPKTYKLKPGKYTFEVRATAGGVADSTPAKYKFKVVEK